MGRALFARRMDLKTISRGRAEGGLGGWCLCGIEGVVEEKVWVEAGQTGYRIEGKQAVFLG